MKSVIDLFSRQDKWLLMISLSYRAICWIIFQYMIIWWGKMSMIPFSGGTNDDEKARPSNLAHFWKATFRWHRCWPVECGNRHLQAWGECAFIITGQPHPFKTLSSKVELTQYDSFLEIRNLTGSKLNELELSFNIPPPFDSYDS